MSPRDPFQKLGRRPAAALKAKIHYLERAQRGLVLALGSHRMGHRRRRSLLQHLDRTNAAITRARSILARLH